MLNPILAFSATRRMRSFRTMLIVIAYVAALLMIALYFLSPFMQNEILLSALSRGPMAYLALLAVQFGLLILIAPAMTAGAVAGERERQTLDLLLVTNTGSFRIVLGKVLESFAVLALLIACSLPVMCLCLLTGGVSIGQILIGELFLLAEAFACVSIGVFCSSISRSTVFSGVLSYVLILVIAVVTTLPIFIGYSDGTAEIVYNQNKFAALSQAEVLGMISPVLFFNPGFGLAALLQCQTSFLGDAMEYRDMGRILCSFKLMDRAGGETVALISCGAIVLLGAALLLLAALLVRKKS